MKQLKICLASVALLLCTITTKSLAAPILSFEGQEQDLVINADIADSFTLSLWISDLGNNEDLGGFNINTLVSGSATDNIDSTYLAPGLAEFDLLSLTLDNPINIAGVSFAIDLSAQADSFALLSFDFLINDYGTTVLDVSSAILSDSFGIEFDFTSFSATVNVERPIIDANAPVSASFVLLFSGIWLFRRNK